jgi:hypothetical protein
MAGLVPAICLLRRVFVPASWIVGEGAWPGVDGWDQSGDDRVARSVA